MSHSFVTLLLCIHYFHHALSTAYVDPLSSINGDSSSNSKGSPRRSLLQSSTPNILIFTIDDMPFLDQWSESAPAGGDLEGKTISLRDYIPTPHIDAFREEAVIFTASYAAGPKCSPSRFSLLTGRNPARNLWAIEKTLMTNNGRWGANVTVLLSNMYSDDEIYNVPNILQDNGYYTGMIGKWHMMTPSEDGNWYGCSDLDDTCDATLYGQCTDLVKDSGFDFVDGFYYANIQDNDDFSHNPEWMVSRAQAFIDEAVDDENKPFFLYFASTLVHSPAADEALQGYSYKWTPKGELSGDEVPSDTSMSNRSEVWKKAEAQGLRASAQTNAFACYDWADEHFGAVIEYLKEKELYDSTMVILQSDHGVYGKGLLYQQGSRIFNFMRYPPLFGYSRQDMPSHFVVSNADVAATIFDLVDVTVPDGYTMDGVSWIDAVQQVIDDPDTEETSCCEYRFLDIQNSHSIVTERYQYIWRANLVVETETNRDTLWPNTYDTEQLYDFESDPDQKVNLITDSTYSAEIARFESLMREYIADICPAQSGLSCFMPDFRFGTTEPTATTASPTSSPSSSPTPHPADNPVVPGSPTKEPSTSVDPQIKTVSPTKAPTASPVVPPILDIVGQLTLKGRYDTLRQYLKANDMESDEFGQDVMLFMIGETASKDVAIKIISVYRGSPNVIVEYQLSSTSSFSLDTAIRTISLQIAAGAVYESGDLSFPAFSNTVISGEEFVSDSNGADSAIIDDDDDSGSSVGMVAILVAVIAVILICTAIGVTVYCLRVKRKRDRELKAMAEIAALPGFQVVNSEDMPFETGKRGHHAVVPSLSFDLMRITPILKGVGAGHARVPSLEHLDVEYGDEAGASPMSTDGKPKVSAHPSMGNHLSLPGGGHSH